MKETYFFSRKSKIILFGLLILLNVIIRIPSIPHEKGVDSFDMHLLANSISLFGEAKWWINGLSIFGLYPYSYASAVPFSLSGISQVTNISVEKSILIYCISLGIFSIFSMYLLGGILYNNFLFKYLASMLFSLSQGILNYTTWDASSRGMFLIFLPIFAYSVLKVRHHMFRSMLILIILFIFLLSTHHYTYFTIPFILVYLFLNIAMKLKFIKVPFLYISYIYIIILLGFFLLPFFTGMFIEFGSRYGWLIETFIIMLRWIGPFVFFSIIGLIYLLLKYNKTFEEWYILLSMLFFVPMMYSQQYGKFLILMYAIIFAGIALSNMFDIFNMRRNLFNIKIFKLYILIIFISFISFSSFYNHYRTGTSIDDWYMSHETYSSGQWTKEYMPQGSLALGTSSEITRLYAASEGHLVGATQDAVDMAYGLVNKSTIQIREVPYLSETFFFEGPYVREGGTSLLGSVSWILYQDNINRPKINEMLKRHNISYILDDKYENYNIKQSVYNKKNNIYSSGRFLVFMV